MELKFLCWLCCSSQLFVGFSPHSFLLSAQDDLTQRWGNLSETSWQLSKHIQQGEQGDSLINDFLFSFPPERRELLLSTGLVLSGSASNVHFPLQCLSLSLVS